MPLFTDILKKVMTQPAIAALVVTTGISIQYLLAHFSRSPEQFEGLIEIDQLKRYQHNSELGISPTSWQACVDFLTHLKETLPRDESKRLAKIGILEESEMPMCTTNLECKNPDTDQYLILMTVNSLNILTPDEIRAALAHEASHILLKHDSGISTVVKTLHAISLNLLLQKSWLVNLSFIGLLWKGSMKEYRDYALVLALSAVTLYITSKLNQEKEFAADAKSLTLTQNSAALISGMEKYQDSMTNNVHSFFYKHFQSFSALHPTFEQRRERLSCQIK